MPEEIELQPEEKQNTSDGDRPNISEAMTPPRWREHKWKILVGILGILVFAGAVFSVYKFGQKQTLPSESCVKADTGKEMSFSEAKEIALKSECVKEGNLKEEHFCNQDTGTWWIDLDIQKEGCASACVINVSTKKAEINWRCTGLIVP